MIDFKKHRFIVSCQAIEGEPMFGSGIVPKMVNAALMGGAEGIRTSQIDNIKTIVQEHPDVLTIGIIKIDYADSEVYITPTIKELTELIATEVKVIAIDATLRKRPKETLEAMVEYFHQHKKTNQLLMADCSDEADVLNAIKLKFDLIGTTMRGYTKATIHLSNTQDNYCFLKWCVQTIKPANIILVAEGGFNTPKEAKEALDLGADAVVVGSAITRPQFITKNFKEFIYKKG